MTGGSRAPAGNPEPDVTPAFVHRVMASVESGATPSAPRSFVEATRDRSVPDAISSLIVATHVALHGRSVPRAVRAQALILVAVVAILTGAGATLAATTAATVAGPVLGWGSAQQHVGDRSEASPSPSPNQDAPAQPGIGAASGGSSHDDRRRAWSRHNQVRRVPDAEATTIGSSGEDPDDESEAGDEDAPGENHDGSIGEQDREHDSGDAGGEVPDDEDDASDADRDDDPSQDGDDEDRDSEGGAGDDAPEHHDEDTEDDSARDSDTSGDDPDEDQTHLD